MRILIDALNARVGGGVTYVQSILPALLRLNRHHTFVILLSSRYQRPLMDTVPSTMDLVQVDLPVEPLVRRWWFQQTRLPQLMQQMQIDLLYAIAESSYFRVPTRFVMQATNWGIYASLDVFGSQRWRMLVYRLTRYLPVFFALQKADRVVCISATFRDHIVHSMRLDSAKTRVVYYGVSSIFGERTPQTDSFLGGIPYFLSVSTIYPHKNYETLLRAYAQLPADAPHLVIAGKPQEESTYRSLRSIVALEAIGDRVHFLGEVPHDKLPALYHGAIAFVFPSRLESFGHPLVEAMASGVPIIASALPVFREICQDAALYFTPDDITTLTDQMRRLQQDVDLRNALAQRGYKRARNFSWDESARKLVEVFEELER